MSSRLRLGLKLLWTIVLVLLFTLLREVRYDFIYQAF
jgi:hypothetical protein